MEVEFTARQGKISKALRAMAEEGMERIARILGKTARSSITFSAQRHVQIVELTVQARLQTIAATGKAGTQEMALRQGLASFVNDARTAPGRFNTFDYKGATLIADYGHNPDAILALVSAVGNMPANRRLVVISGAGDRRDEDIRRQTEILGDAFDTVLLYQDQCQRGRADGEVLALLQQGLQHARRAKIVEEILGEFNAIDSALARLLPGDLCLILIDQVDQALAYIAEKVAQE